MKFQKLASYFEQIEKTSSRLTITQLLADLLKELKDEEIQKTVYLLQGRVFPLYQPIEFGMGEKMIARAAVSALHLEKSYFEKEYRKFGDVGKTVENFKKQFRSFEEKDIDVLEVYDELYKLAVLSGGKSQEGKVSILANLIRALDPLSCRYLVRIPLATLRLGFSDMTVLDAFSWMLKKDKSLRPQIEKAFHVRPDLGDIGYLIKTKGIKGLIHIKPEIFTPIIMMRAERLSSSTEIVEKIGKCIVEPKYDGFRLQAHYKKTGKEIEVKLYSRNLEEVSFMYPDIVDAIKKEVNAQEVIFEGEAVGFDQKTGRPLPFQEIVQRKRKYDIEELAKKIPLKLYVFELLYQDGKSFLNEKFEDRKEKLSKLIKKDSKTIIPAPDIVTDDAAKLDQTFDDAVAKGLEGVIAKKMDGIYQPGARGWNWIKFKRSYSSKVKDTIDCLVMGYDAGRGKRVGFGMGAFLAGVYDDKNDKYLTVAKIGTGLTDKEWKELKKRCDKHKTSKKPARYVVDKMMYVDGWVNPAIIVEIKSDEISRSPVHTAGKSDKSNTGYALRFPRLETFRDDKRPEDTTTLTELEALYKMQKK